MVEDVTLRHPELLLRADTPLASGEVAGRLDRAEHDGVARFPAEPGALAAAARGGELTPVGSALLTLLGTTEAFA